MVIAAWSVVERWQQIGMLRALGFQKGQFRLTFLLESSFLALLGIGLGVALGAALSNKVISGLTEDLAWATYQVPWALLGTVMVLSYSRRAPHHLSARPASLAGLPGRGSTLRGVAPVFERGLYSPLFLSTRNIRKGPPVGEIRAWSR